MNIKNIVTYLDNLFDLENFDEYSYNGLQVEADSEIENICFSVDIGLEVIENCPQNSLLIVHHGLFWKGANPCIKNTMANRVKLMLQKTSLFMLCICL